MKKMIALFILTMMAGLFYNPISSSANEVLDKGVRKIENYGEFNYFRGLTPNEYNGSGVSDTYFNYFESWIYSGTLEHTITLKNTTDNEYDLRYSYEYVDSALTHVRIYFEDVIIYHSIFESDLMSEVKVCEKIIVEEKTKVKNDYFKVTSYGLITGSDEVQVNQDDMEEIGMFLIQGHRFLYNEAYKNKDVYFVTSIENLISFEDIKSKISASDPTEGDMTDKIEIYNNTYDPTSEDITIGNYSFDIVVYDNTGNTTYQTCYVKVVDLEAPVIVAGEEMNVPYTSCSPWTTFLKNFTVTDNVEVASIEIIEDNYTSNYKKPGTYTLTALAKDTSGNEASATMTINVVDEIGPVIEGPYEITTTTLNPLNKEDLREYFTFNDAIDSNVTQYEISDNDGYFDNSNVPGRYSLKITAYDKYGNPGIKNFVVIVKDIDYPSISVDSEYTIIVDNGVQLTKQQIIEFLNSLGVLSQTVVDVESVCFDEDNPTGTYDAKIVLEDGTVINNRLVISENVSYAPPVVNGVDYSVAVVCGILMAILLILVIYFGRVRRLQNRR